VLPLRFRFTDTMTFRDLLRQTRTTALDAYDHSQAPYHQVVQRLAQRHTGRIGPLPQISLAFANLPYQDVELDGVRIERFPIDRVDIRYPLELHLWSDDDTLAGRLLHRTDTLDARTAHDLARAYHDALRLISAEPDLPIRDWALSVPDFRPSPVRPPSVDAGPADQSAGSPAMSATEETLYGIWADLLHTDDIEPSASFLHLGGHSLLVALMVAQVRETFAVELPVPVVYQDPTLKGVAAAIDTRT
jgi:non-ribosomal peptide synthetase component F